MTDITEAEWEDRFQRYCDPTEDEPRLLEPLDDVVHLLDHIGEEFAWTKVDRVGGGYMIVAGITKRAIGHYLCTVARTTPADEDIVAIIPPADNA
jgi:hypothetical protein